MRMDHWVSSALCGQVITDRPRCPRHPRGGWSQSPRSCRKVPDRGLTPNRAIVHPPSSSPEATFEDIADSSTSRHCYEKHPVVPASGEVGPELRVGEMVASRTCAAVLTSMNHGVGSCVEGYRMASSRSMSLCAGVVLGTLNGSGVNCCLSPSSVTLQGGNPCRHTTS